MDHYSFFFFRFLQILIEIHVLSSLVSSIQKESNKSLCDTDWFTISALIILSVGSQWLSNRTFVMMGALSAFAAYIFNAFLPGISYLILSQGILFGEWLLSKICLPFDCFSLHIDLVDIPLSICQDRTGFVSKQERLSFKTIIH